MLDFVCACFSRLVNGDTFPRKKCRRKYCAKCQQSFELILKQRNKLSACDPAERSQERMRLGMIIEVGTKPSEYTLGIEEKYEMTEGNINVCARPKSHSFPGLKRIDPAPRF